MAFERFRGADLSQVSLRARRTFGDDVMILHTRTIRDGGAPMVEVLATSAATLDRVTATLEPVPFEPVMRDENGSPYLIALVGPTGAGKTTTAAKLAVKPQLFGAAKTGLLTIDSYRIGGMEQLSMYAELAGIPFEIVYDKSEVESALNRLDDCDVIIIDTPGRSPSSTELTLQWRSLLDVIAPNETHLVIPASLRPDLAFFAAQNYRSTREHSGATHLLLSKLDEVPHETGVTDMALSVGLPARWITDGQDVPTDLKPGLARLLRAYGLAVESEHDWSPA